MGKARSLQDLFNKPCTCLLAAAEAHQFPEWPVLPEIAFVGRSNVGKSSLINAMMSTHNLARASNTPGRTQQIVFFELENSLMLVDLPGYGHARAPKKVKESWNRLMGAYLTQRPPLTCVFLLIDARRGIMPSDDEMMAMLDEFAVSYQVIITKADLIKAPALEKLRQDITAQIATYPAARPDVMLSSSQKKLGMKELRQLVFSFAQ